MRIVFMGTPGFAVGCLKAVVASGHEVVAVVTAPDKPAGRGNKLTAPPVKEAALELGIPVLQPPKLKDPGFLKDLESLHAEVFVVVAFRMLPKEVWAMPPRGTFNLHASLLPQFRGAAPIHWAIMEGMEETGVTTFFLNENIDTGAIILQEKRALPLEWTAGDLHDALMEQGAKLIVKTLDLLEKGEVVPKVQEAEGEWFAAPKLWKENTRIQWDLPRKRIYDWIRGLSPFPTAWTTLGGKLVKIQRAGLDKGPEPGEEKPGALLREGKRMWVRAGDAWLEILELQLEGKTRMTAQAFLQGYSGVLDQFV